MFMTPASGKGIRSPVVDRDPAKRQAVAWFVSDKCHGEATRSLGKKPWSPWYTAYTCANHSRGMYGLDSASQGRAGGYTFG